MADQLHAVQAHQWLPEAEDTCESICFTPGKPETACREWQRSSIQKARIICCACFDGTDIRLIPSDWSYTLGVLATSARHTALVTWWKWVLGAGLGCLLKERGWHISREPVVKEIVTLPTSRSGCKNKQSQMVQLHWKQAAKRKTKGSSTLLLWKTTRSFGKVIIPQNNILVSLRHLLYYILLLKIIQGCDHGYRLKNMKPK